MIRLILSIFAFTNLLALLACGSVQADKLNRVVTPCEIALATHDGEAAIDKEIQQLQQQLRRDLTARGRLEKLGWKFVEKARASYDTGFYKLAEQCALCLEQSANNQTASRNEQTNEQAKAESSRAAWLLRGHVLHSLHRFAEAETIARELTAQRELPFDFGLLGDVLMEQGKLDDAAQAYQRMMDLKPSPQAYSRAAHLRWLRGDLNGAIVLMKLSTNAAPGNAEAAAWTYTRQAMLEWQAGQNQHALNALNAAFSLVNDYAPAMLVRGRMLLAENKFDAAINNLQRAAQLNPLPEYQWTFAEALRAAKRDDEARAVEAELVARGALNDPRTLALYLATRGEQVTTALQLAGEEFKVRADVHTLDALAWAQLANGNAAEAWATMQRALKENTPEARFYLHAAIIAARAGQTDFSQQYARKATAMKHLLLPSERQLLATHAALRAVLS